MLTGNQQAPRRRAGRAVAEWRPAAVRTRLTAEELRLMAELDFSPQPGDRSRHHIGARILLASMAASAVGFLLLLRLILSCL